MRPVSAGLGLAQRPPQGKGQLFLHESPLCSNTTAPGLLCSSLSLGSDSSFSCVLCLWAEPESQ